MFSASSRHTLWRFLLGCWYVVFFNRSLSFPSPNPHDTQNVRRASNWMKMYSFRVVRTHLRSIYCRGSASAGVYLASYSFSHYTKIVIHLGWKEKMSVASLSLSFSLSSIRPSSRRVSSIPPWFTPPLSLLSHSHSIHVGVIYLIFYAATIENRSGGESDSGSDGGSGSGSGISSSTNSVFPSVRACQSVSLIECLIYTHTHTHTHAHAHAHTFHFAACSRLRSEERDLVRGPAAGDDKRSSRTFGSGITLGIIKPIGRHARACLHAFARACVCARTTSFDSYLEGNESPFPPFFAR